jgi:cell division septum initiation protein DivIVA
MKKEATTGATATTFKATDVMDHASNRAVNVVALWAEANQRVMNQLLELSVGTAKEGIRLYAELQQGAIDAMRDTQATAMKWQTSLQEVPKDPMQWYQQALLESVDGAQKFFRMLEGNAQAMTRTAERLHTTAEQAGKGIQATVEATVSRVKDAYSQN